MTLTTGFISIPMRARERAGLEEEYKDLKNK